MSLKNLRWTVLLAGLFVVTAIAFGAVTTNGAVPGISPTASLSHQARVSDRLYFGRKHANGIVSETEWAGFLADVVTPRFPQGLTVWAADGQWRDSAQRINREPTFVLEVVHPAQPSADAALKAIVAEYRSRFTQESVFWVRDRVNVID
jgi:hypothetical protein